MKHLKTFESFSQVNEEEIFGKLFGDKIEKEVTNFINSNKDDFDELKAAEKEKGERLKKIQTQLLKKLQDHKPKLKNALKDVSDVNTAVRELTDKIKNIDPEDTRTTIQKLASGASGGFPGGKAKK